MYCRNTRVTFWAKAIRQRVKYDVILWQRAFAGNVKPCPFFSFPLFHFFLFAVFLFVFFPFLLSPYFSFTFFAFSLFRLPPFPPFPILYLSFSSLSPYSFSHSPRFPIHPSPFPTFSEAHFDGILLLLFLVCLFFVFPRDVMAHSTSVFYDFIWSCLKLQKLFC